MISIINSLSRSKLLLISFILGVLSLFFGYFSTNNQCFLDYGQCENMAYIFSIFIPLFLITLIFSFINKNFFDKWKKFVVWFVPISILIIIVSPLRPADLFPLYKKTIFLFETLVMLLSSIVILVKSFSRNN